MQPEKPLTCFKAYDVRGQLGHELNEEIAYRIGRAFAQFLSAKRVVVGRDARETSPGLCQSLSQGLRDAGAEVLDIGLSGTEEIYWATTAFDACGGIEVTASHNPIDYNGLKMVKAGSKPLDPALELAEIKRLAEQAAFEEPLDGRIGERRDINEQAKVAYVEKVLSFVDCQALKPFKLVVNSGNGAAGPTFDRLAEGLDKAGAALRFERLYHEPDHRFPNGIPNPLLPENHAPTRNLVLSSDADMGIAFDGDFDRCFFFDEKGAFIPGEYMVGLLASVFLEKFPGAKIVHDPRVIWNTQDLVKEKGGISVQAKTGHAFVKQVMREHEAVYGGEMSAHHYFKEFAFCDSGMIPWLLIAELMSLSNKPLSQLVSERMKAFPSSGENNFKIEDPAKAIAAVEQYYAAQAIDIDRMDGLGMSFETWRFNLRSSNTEPLVRLNVESKDDAELIELKLKEIKGLL